MGKYCGDIFGHIAQPYAIVRVHTLHGNDLTTGITRIGRKQGTWRNVLHLLSNLSLCSQLRWYLWCVYAPREQVYNPAEGWWGMVLGQRSSNVCRFGGRGHSSSTCVQMGHTCSHQPKLSALLGRLMLITPWWYINVDWFSFASWSTKSPFNHFPIYPKRRAAVFNKATGMRYSGPRVITWRLQDWLDISQQHSLCFSV